MTDAPWPQHAPKFGNIEFDEESRDVLEPVGGAVLALLLQCMDHLAGRQGLVDHFVAGAVRLSRLPCSPT